MRALLSGDNLRPCRTLCVHRPDSGMCVRRAVARSTKLRAVERLLVVSGRGYERPPFAISALDAADPDTGSRMTADLIGPSKGLPVGRQFPSFDHFPGTVEQSVSAGG